MSKHNFKRSMWGHNILSFVGDVRGTVKISAIGLDVAQNDEIEVCLPDGDALYLVQQVEYVDDPFDYFNATVTYLKHLNGMPIVNQDLKNV